MQPLIIAANILLSPDKKQVLLIHRRKSPYANHYAFIGGKTEFGETLEGSLFRETQEESGVTVEFHRPFAILNETYMKDGKLTAHFLIHYWLSISDMFSPIENREGVIAWYPINSLPNPMVPSDKKILDLVISGKTGLFLIEGILEEKPDEQLSLSHWILY
ncbi:MAG: NUDIX domain-containing protein [Methanobacteriota archaeon]|nr:MAG: NUDIX domain-containing protein [Euryarchaeota archaeon]